MKIHLFGKPCVEQADGGVVAGLPKKAFAVAAFVARSPQTGRGKNEIAGFLWPDLATSQRANNLRQRLYRIRQFELGCGCLLFQVGEFEIQMVTGAVDLFDFEEMARDISLVDATQLLEIYRGRLLEGRAHGLAVEQWLADQRLQLEDQFVDLLLSSVERLASEPKKSALRKAIRVAPTALGPRKTLLRQLIADDAIPEARRLYREIQHIGGHAAIALPKELVAELAQVRPRQSHQPTVPLSQIGRDQASVPHLALLPPRGEAVSPEAQAMAEGLVDDVTVALTRLRSVSVLAPHTARIVARGNDEGGEALARADFVLRTKLAASSARNRGGMPYLTLILERSASGDVVWADGIALDPELGPVQFAAITNGLALTLVDQVERATLRAFQVPSDAGAYGHYLLGLSALQVLDLPSTRRARASFKSALNLSPNFAPAHTGYAQSMIYEWVLRGQGDNDLVVRARHAAERARDIDPLFGSAHQMLGRASLFEGDFTGSLAHFERAELLNPHHADLLCDFADTLMHSSLAERANAKIELALRLNPLAPDAYWWASAGIKFFVGEYEGALAHLGKVKNSEPVLRLTAACAAMAGQHDLAKQARNRFLAIDPGFKLDDWIGVLPVRDPSHRRQYRQALQKAGFK